MLRISRCHSRFRSQPTSVNDGTVATDEGSRAVGHRGNGKTPVVLEVAGGALGDVGERSGVLGSVDTS